MAVAAGRRGLFFTTVAVVVTMLALEKAAGAVATKSEIPAKPTEVQHFSFATKERISKMSSLRDSQFSCWRLPLGFPVAGAPYLEATEAVEALHGLQEADRDPQVSMLGRPGDVLEISLCKDLEEESQPF